MDTLSPGVRQLVEIARAIASEARVIVMDEPTSSLGREDAGRLLELVRRLRADGLSVVYISHHLEEIRAIADRYTVLRDGRSVAHGAMSDIDDDGLVESMIGRSIDAVFPERRSEIGETSVRIRGLRGADLPRDASLEVRRGEIVGLAGLVGSGRSELLRTIAGLERTIAGTIEIDGCPLDPRTSPGRRLQAGIGLLSEDRKGEGLALRMTVAENLLLPRLGPMSRRGILSLRGMERATRIWTRRLSIRSGDPDRRVGTLSGGNQQKIALARLLHQDASVLLLDEPTRGVDVGSRVEVYRLLDGLAREGRTVIVASGHLPELLGLCDRICVMHRGRLGPLHEAASCTEASLLSEALRGSDSTGGAAA